MPKGVCVYVALLIAAVAAVVVTLALRSYGVVYLGRTMGGLTSVHDDTHTLGERIRVLEVASSYQSATYLDERWADPVFAYHRLFDHLFDAWPSGAGPRSVAVLGGGGYALPKHLVAHHPELARIDVVELDPTIERLARRFFFLDRLEERFGAERAGRLCLHVADAHAWLAAHTERFDVIINDCFLGFDPEQAFVTHEGALLLQERLAPEGLYLSNVISALEGADGESLYTALEALCSVFAHVWVYPCSPDNPERIDNNVLIATNRNCSFAGAWEWPPRE